jgi:hypothetical protein
MIYAILLILFLLLMGAALSASLAKRSDRGERPQIYWNESFMNLINALMLPAVIIFIILLFYDWKTTLITSFIAWVINGFRIINLVKISEYVVVLPLAKLIMKIR